MTETRLILLLLEVENLEASLHFYRDLLGIELVEDKDHGGNDRWISGEHAALSWTNSFLHFALYQSKGAVTRDVQIGFPVKDLATMHARLQEENVPISHEPRSEPWGLTARYRDPDGNSVSLTERR